MFAGVVREAFERPKREAARLTEFEAKVEAGRVAIQQGNLAEAEKRLGDALDFLGRNADMLRGVNPAGFASLREQCRIAGSTPKVEDTILSMTDEEFKQYASTGRIEGRVYFDDPDVNRYFVRVLETRRPDAARLRAEETKRKTEELKRQALAEKEAERESKRREQSLRADMVSAREKYADILERQYLDQGMDIYVSVSGPDKTTIKLEYVLMSRPLAHQFSNNDAALSALRSLGFRKLVFSNKQEVWTMSL